MPDQLMKTLGANFDLATTDGRTNQYDYSPEAEAIYKEWKLHQIAQVAYVGKTEKAIGCTRRIGTCAVNAVSQFSSEAFAVVENVVRTPSEQAYVEAAVEQLLAVFPQYIAGHVQVGVTAIGYEVAKNVSVKPRRKWGWQK
jgi:hypothetical protein